MRTLDHLVVMAASLEQGVAWCEATLGVTPGPGGEHPLMGTHNRLLKIATNDFPRAYLEIIAIKPDEGVGGRAVCAAGGGHGAERPATHTHRRWFDMDDSNLQARVSQHGPQLIHWVAAVEDVASTVAAMAVQGIDRGEVLQASRQTPAGLLHWQISVRDDGQRLFDGCLPTLIQWGDTHPTLATLAMPAMPDSGVTLQGLRLQHPQAGSLQTALARIGLTTIAVADGPAQLSATLQTPKGLIEIHT